MKKIVLKNGLSETEREIVESLSKTLELSPRFISVLFNRGYDTEEKIKKFLNPGKNNFYNPLFLSGMKEAVERITAARDFGETVLIYGDYDADGISATATLYHSLKEFGIDALTVIPEREQGYGLNESIIEKYAEDNFIDLIITVDCGISDREVVKYVKEDLGIDIIVTDHHEIPELIPETIVINPHLKGQNYPFENLCGAGVAFKLATALIGKSAEKYLDFVALATVADSMPLIGENRDIVYEGLKIFNSPSVKKAFKYLGESAGVKTFTSQSLAFAIAPRINAAGRMGDAFSSLKAMLLSSDSEVYSLCEKLALYNIERQGECDKLYKEAKIKLEKVGAYKNIIMLYDESWKTGFVGIVAAKLVEEYARPVILFAGANGNLKGSARSIPNVNIFEAISSGKEFTEEFGGHAQAAGVAVKKENFNKFENAVNDYISANYDKSVFTPTVVVEDLIEEKFPFELAEELELLEPCGIENKKPLYAVEGFNLAANRLKPYSPHLTFSAGNTDLIYFNGEKNLEILNSAFKKQIVFEPNINVFNGKKSFKGIVKEVLYGYSQSEEIKTENLFKRFLSVLNEKDSESVKYATREELFSLAKSAAKNPYGSCFIFSSAEDIKNYPFLEFCEISYLYPSDKTLKNTVLIAPADLSGLSFENVFYFGEDLFITALGKNTYAPIGIGRIENVSKSREIFSEIFLTLKRLNGQKFSSFYKLYTDFFENFSDIQFAFTFAVFCELGFFTFDNGLIAFNPTVKKELTLSTLYNMAV